MKITKELLDSALQSDDFWINCRKDIVAEKDDLFDLLKENRKISQLIQMVALLTITTGPNSVEPGMIALLSTGVRLGWHMRELELLENSAKS
jgi:hypothetical protein